MHDEPPATRTTEKPIADSAAEPTDDRCEFDDRPKPDDRQEPDGETPATGPAPPRSRDGVDPPDEEVATAPGDEADRDDRGCDCDDPDRDGLGEEPLAYRLERLRLWRTLTTLAVVVARLIRSL